MIARTDQARTEPFRRDAIDSILDEVHRTKLPVFAREAFVVVFKVDPARLCKS